MAYFLIGPPERDALIDLRERAEAAPVDVLSLRTRLANPEGKAAHMAQMSSQSLIIPDGYLVTYSVEIGHPGGAARHLSMSSEREGKVPHPAAVWMVAEVLGFTGGGIEACDKVWPEKLRGRVGVAVNAVQLIATADAAEGPRPDGTVTS
jgi:hypothetical protein